MKIIIAGAGIGGLAAAALLSDQGHCVTLYDQFERPKPVGSGLIIQPVGLAVLNQIGIGQDCVSNGNAIRRMLGIDVKSNRRVLDVGYNLIGASNAPDSFGLAIHRAQLFDQLFQAVLQRKIKIHSGCTVSTHQQGRLIFTDGEKSEAADLIIDALGANSPLSPLRSKKLPFGAIWGTVPWPKNTTLNPEHLSQRYHKARHMIGIMECGKVPQKTGNHATVFWSLPRHSYEQWRADGIDAWKSQAIALWPELTPFLEQIPSIDDMTMATYTHGTMRQPYSKGIAHIGDAAHRASPQLGQGGNMALLDALALTQALNDDVTLPETLQKFANLRRHHIMIYQIASWLFTPMYQSHSQILPLMRDRLLFPFSQIPQIHNILTRLVRGDLISPGPDLIQK